MSPADKNEIASRVMAIAKPSGLVTFLMQIPPVQLVIAVVLGFLGVAAIIAIPIVRAKRRRPLPQKDTSA